MVANKACDVVGHGEVVVARRVGGFAVVAQVLCSEGRGSDGDEEATGRGWWWTYHRVDMTLKIASEDSNI